MSTKPANKPSAITLLKSADANLSMIHETPTHVQPLSLVQMREYAVLLRRIAGRVEDLLAELDSSR
jgi:hypothetical protein